MGKGVRCHRANELARLNVRLAYSWSVCTSEGTIGVAALVEEGGTTGLTNKKFAPQKISKVHIYPIGNS